MKGETIKEKIIQKGLTLTEVAERLSMSRQLLNGLLARDNVQTGTLEKIAAAIDEPVSYFYNEYPILSVDDYARVKFMEKEIRYLRALVEEKEKQIKLLQDK